MRFAACWIVSVMAAGVIGAAAAADPLAETIASYKKPGEPLDIADFLAPAVPDADNAAMELRAAAKLIKADTRAWQAFDRIENFTPPLSDSTVKTLRDVVAENVAVIAHVDASVQRGGVDWQVKMKSPVFETLLPHLNEQRLLAHYLAAHASLAHQDGDDAEALRDVRRLIVVSRAVDHQGFLIGHLVSLGVSGVACSVVERIAPDLKAVEPKQVKELVAMLLDDGPSRAGMREGLLAERMSQVDTTRSLLDGRLTMARLLEVSGRNNPPALVREISPAQAKADLALLLGHSTAMLKPFDATSNWPAYRSRDPGRPAELGNNLKAHPVAAMLFPAVTRAFETHYRGATERRLAAVALAVRAYAGAHDGNLPDSLDALLPDYLPTVPDDPMAEAMPLQYQSDLSRPIVYSVGTNGSDDGGSEGAPPGSGGGRWQSDDAVMRLSRSLANAAPAAAAAAPDAQAKQP